jgi:hypothetical protein
MVQHTAGHGAKQRAELPHRIPNLRINGDELDRYRLALEMCLKRLEDVVPAVGAPVLPQLFDASGGQ